MTNDKWQMKKRSTNPNAKASLSFVIRIFFVIWILIYGFMLSSCGVVSKDTSSNPKAQMISQAVTLNCFPLNIGDKWVYQGSDDEGVTWSATREIVSTGSLGAQVVFVEKMSDKKSSKLTYWQTTSKDVKWLGEKDSTRKITFISPLLYLSAPASLGLSSVTTADCVSVSDASKVSGNIRLTYEVASEEILKVAFNGSLKTLKIYYSVKISERPTSDVVIWYANALGPVKYFWPSDNITALITTCDIKQ
jgi:hypothetical protein